MAPPSIEEIALEWDAMCSKVPNNLPLAETMKQQGTLVGPDGRRAILFSTLRAITKGEVMDAFQNNVNDFVNQTLLITDQASKRHLDLTELPQPKKGKPTDNQTSTDPTFVT
jgi:hypothetical protein